MIDNYTLTQEWYAMRLVALASCEAGRRCRLTRCKWCYDDVDPSQFGQNTPETIEACYAAIARLCGGSRQTSSP